MEIKLEKNDTIISKTDIDGKITYVNDKFIEISEYLESELIGQPHNILRHHAMPRVIFELLWKKVQAEEPIFAYVVNKTAKGNYYWVLAHVTPVVEDGIITGYQSLRRNPNPIALDIIKPVYQQMLEVEKSGNTEGSMAILEEILLENKTDYNGFIMSLQTKRA